MRSWKSQEGNEVEWSGWLPHLDLELARAMTEAQRHVAELCGKLAKPGVLTLKTQLDPSGLFYPAIQLNSTLDYPPEDDRFLSETSFGLISTQPFAWGEAEGSLKNAPRREGEYEGKMEIPLNSTDARPLVIQLKTGEAIPHIRIRWEASLASGGKRSGSVAVHRFLLPWAEASLSDKASTMDRTMPELADANWGRGRHVFLSQQAGCSKCHTAHGVGEKIGPDLSNLIHRDYESVVRDIKHPSYSINPDYITYNALLKDSRVLTGALRSEGDQFWISDQQANVTAFSRSEIDTLKASSLSIMPEGIVRRTRSSAIE